MNALILIGRITKDLDLKYLNNAEQTAKVRFSLAVDRFKKGEADFIPVQVFGKQAENLCKYCGKGSRIGVQGRLQSGLYEKDGTVHYTLDVIAERVEFLNDKKNVEPDGSQVEAQDFAEVKETLPF